MEGVTDADTDGDEEAVCVSDGVPPELGATDELGVPLRD